MERIVILGGGFAGLTLATELDRLAADGKAEVTLVERNASFQMGFSMQWVLADRRTPEQGQRPYSALRAPHVRFLHDEVAFIDTNARIVHTKAHDLKYDRLVVALGAELALELVPGLAEGAYNLCDVSSILHLKQAVSIAEGGTILILVSSVPFKCPPAPYEYAFLIDDLLRQRGVRDTMRLVVTTPEPQPIPLAGKAVGDAIKAMLAERGIEFHPTRKPKLVDPERRVVSYDDGSSLEYDILAAMPPHRAPRVVRDAGLTDASGFVPVKLGSFASDVSGVYAVGDVAAIKLPAGNPHPKAGVFAEAQALVVARALAAELGAGSAMPYPGTGACFIDVGQGKAVPAEIFLLEAGGPRFVLGPPSEAGLEGKRRFERERFEQWFGA